MFPNFIIIIDIIAQDINKALSFWAVTIFNPAWVIKIQILDGFLFNSVLARPQIASVGARQNCKKPPTFPAQSFQPSFQDTKAHIASFFPESPDKYPRADCEKPQAKQQM